MRTAARAARGLTQQAQKAYPVGFAATKVHFGREWRMDILEGADGLPLFVLTDARTGEAFRGGTPTAPWTKLCVARNLGARCSGPLHFGFSDEVTQRAIAQMYTHEELDAALRGRRLVPPELREAVRDFQRVPGVGETVACALAATTGLGGTRHASLGALARWAAADDGRRLLEFLRGAEEMPAATRRWPKWQGVLAPRIVREVLASRGEPQPPRGDGPPAIRVRLVPAGGG